MATKPRTLQQDIELFIAVYAPIKPVLRDECIRILRDLMNRYAKAALEHGDIPEVGVPHKGGL